MNTRRTRSSTKCTIPADLIGRFAKGRPCGAPFAFQADQGSDRHCMQGQNALCCDWQHRIRGRPVLPQSRRLPRHIFAACGCGIDKTTPCRAGLSLAGDQPATRNLPVVDQSWLGQNWQNFRQKGTDFATAPAKTTSSGGHFRICCLTFPDQDRRLPKSGWHCPRNMRVLKQLLNRIANCLCGENRPANR